MLSEEIRPVRRPSLIISIPNTDASVAPRLASDVAKNVSRTFSSVSETQNKQNNSSFITIHPDECWTASIDEAKPEIPDKIITGLYLGNAETAAAYLLGKLDNNPDYPAVSRIVTVLTDHYDRFGYASFPEPGGVETNILRMIIEKLDTNETNLMEDFDRAGEFIDEGVRSFKAGSDRQAMSPVAQSLQARNMQEVSVHANQSPRIVTSTRRARSSRIVLSSPTQTPLSPTLSRAGTLYSKPTTSLSLTEVATGSMSMCVQSPTFSFHSTRKRPDICSSRKAKPKSKPGAVLVHCHAGVSRSTTIVTAYLLKYHPHLFQSDPTHSLSCSLSAENLDGQDLGVVPGKKPSPKVTDIYQRAIDFVQSKRKITNPNIGFRLQLKFYSDVLDCSIRDPETGQLKDQYLDWYERWEAENESCIRTRRGVENSIFAGVIEGKSDRG